MSAVVQHLEPIPGTLCRSLASSGRACDDCRDKTAASPTALRNCTCCTSAVDVWCYDCNRHICLDCCKTHHATHQRFALLGPQGSSIGLTTWSSEFEDMVRGAMKKQMLVETYTPPPPIVESSMPASPISEAQLASPKRSLPGDAVVDLSGSPQKHRKTMQRPDEGVSSLTEALTSLDTSSSADAVFKDAIIDEYDRWNEAVAAIDQNIKAHASRLAQAATADIPVLNAQLVSMRAEQQEAVDARNKAVAKAISYLPEIHGLLETNKQQDIPIAVMSYHAKCAKIRSERIDIGAKLATMDAQVEEAIVADDYESLATIGNAMEELKAKKNALDTERDKHFCAIAHSSPAVRKLLAEAKASS
ncbi:hypothetical protein ACHHYP_10080 [Achlya hypogyna]|uniref:B box-type domain-containing protein n=1 Tax=Achlya hypogyna TaxID=1202772 RepID=A0A1V9ZIV1_ACHHY|nr:hypothetical protein ACHHYP_10080 [Achlya hypogyna]